MRDIGALQERIKLMQDEIATQVAEENSRSLFVLTMVTVLALPINLVAGLMGMNVGGVPFAEQKHLDSQLQSCACFSKNWATVARSDVADWSRGRPPPWAVIAPLRAGQATDPEWPMRVDYDFLRAFGVMLLGQNGARMAAPSASSAVFSR